MGLLDGFFARGARHVAAPQTQRANYAKPPLNTVTVSSQAAQSYKSMFSGTKELEYKQDYWNIYVAGGPAATAIDIRVNSVWTNGWKIDGDDQALNDEVKKALDAMDFELHAKMATRDGFLFKWGIHEIAQTVGGTGRRLVTRCAKDFLRQDDPKSGEPVAFIQRAGTGYSAQTITLDAKDAIMVMPIMTADGLGVSLIERAKKQIEWYDKISTATADAIYRHGNPVWQISLGGPNGEQAPADVIAGMESITTDLDARAELVTNATSAIKELNAGGVPNAQAYGDWCLSNLAVAMGIPELFFGMGHRSTDATAKHSVRTFYDDVASEQFTIAAQYQDKLIDDMILVSLGRKPGEAKFTFNNPNPENDIEKADYLLKLANINPMDPYALMSLDEQKQYLGIQIQQVPEVMPQNVRQPRPVR